MLIETRKNNNYTSILLQEMSLNAFNEAKKVYDSIEGIHKVIKPSKKALIAFVESNPLSLREVQAGQKYTVLGTEYEVIRNYNPSENGNDWYAIVRYFDNRMKEFKEYGILCYENFAMGVHETSFKNQTNTLLYY